MIDWLDYICIEKFNICGKVLGGSIVFNYYIWVWGLVVIFNDWEEFGGFIWNWENIKEYFNKLIIYYDDFGFFFDDIKSIGNKGGFVDIFYFDLVFELKFWCDVFERVWVSKGYELIVDVYNGV